MTSDQLTIWQRRNIQPKKMWAPRFLNACNKLNDVQPNDLFTYGILQRITRSKLFMHFASFERRRITFNTCRVKLNQDPEILSKNGFYYIGNAFGKVDDSVKCFFCKGILVDWNVQDDPWEEHARNFPNCGFLLLNKGRVYVNQIRNNMKSNQKILTKELFVDMLKRYRKSRPNPNISILNNRLSFDDLTENNDEKYSALTMPNPKRVKRENPTLPDDMLCKICLGEKVKLAIVPCGHIFGCVLCTLSVTKCIMCRKPFNTVMAVKLTINTNPRDIDVRSSSTQESNSIKCEVCNKVEKGAVNIPCKHLTTCLSCASKSGVCSVCSEEKICIYESVFIMIIFL